MTPVPASKKYWVFDGSIEQYPSALPGGTIHGGLGCDGCHGGTDAGTSRETAHVGGFDPFARADATNCQGCHAATAASAAAGLHTTLGGYEHILAQRGFQFSDGTSLARFQEQCSKCHTADPADATPEGETACGQCHVSVPATAGGGLLAGHAFQQTPSMDNNCTACHGSRVKDEFYGQNNELLARNKEAFDSDSPWKDAAYALSPDVHKTKGYTCTSCHGADEMHGVGHPAAGTGDRYHVATAASCEDCHTNLTDLNSYHRASHLAGMDCQVCHAQPYKNCFGCHTDVTDEGLAFFKINEGDPTLADRKAASSNPDSVYPDSLMTFRVGLNPRFGEAGQRKYALLRHVPVDRDTFRYSGVNEIDGLIPNVVDSSTWKRATPHGIVRNTPIATNCANCHGATASLFWLTDAVADAQGWVPAAYEDDEDTANGDVIAPLPIPTSGP